MEIIKLNLIPSGATPVVHVKQYDIGRTWRFELYEGASVYTLDGTEVLECDVKKLDGNIVTISVTNTSDNYVDIETTLQMTACSGDQIGALRITKGGDDIATLNFILACQRSPLDGGISSDSDIHDLQTQVAGYVAAEVADQYDSANVLFDATPTAGHGIPYAVTSEGIKTELDLKANTSSLATVATSGSYSDLLNKPTIPAAQVNSDWNANTGVAQILNKPTIPTLDSAESSGVVGVNGTWQIPAAVLNHSLVIVSIRRQGVGNSAIFGVDDLKARDNGFMLASSPTSYGIVKCDSNGLLTVTNLTNMNDVFIRAIGIF